MAIVPSLMLHDCRPQKEAFYVLNNYKTNALRTWKEGGQITWNNQLFPVTSLRVANFSSFLNVNHYFKQSRLEFSPH